MSDVEPAELSGLSRACEVLAAGGAVVVPNPAPMAYGLVATSAAAINAAKRRPVDQNVGVSLHNRSEWQLLAPSIDLPPASLDGVVALLSRRLTILLPLRTGMPHPAWVTPAVRDGYLAAFNGHWAALPDASSSAGGHHRADQRRGQAPAESPTPALQRVAVPGYQRLTKLVVAVAIVGGPLGYLVGGLLEPAAHLNGQATIAANAAASPIPNTVHMIAFVIASYLGTPLSIPGEALTESVSAPGLRAARS